MLDTHQSQDPTWIKEYTEGNQTLKLQICSEVKQNILVTSQNVVTKQFYFNVTIFFPLSSSSTVVYKNRKAIATNDDFQH